MKAILFGSIGSIAETSEIQRASYNEAFSRHQLTWNWPQAEYAAMLEQSGGIRRLEEFADQSGEKVNAAAIHQTKFEVFRELLADRSLSPRAGVADTIRWAKANDVRLGLVTTTYRNTIEIVIEATDDISLSDFDVITDVSSVTNRKPAPDCYTLAIEQLGVNASDCLAIEDNVDGLQAALRADLNCFCFPGENTRKHSFPDDVIKIERVTPDLFSTLTS